MSDKAHPPATPGSDADGAPEAHPATKAGAEAHGTPEAHAEPTAFGLDATGWVSLAMVVVFAILLWKRVPAIVGAALDRKIATIRDQLAEAAQLRAEAEALKAEYEAKAAAADAERTTMLDRARQEADMIVEQARTQTASLIERRTLMAQNKIAAAERQAVEDVRARAASAAAAAAARLIAEDMDAATDKALVERTIADLGRAH